MSPTALLGVVLFVAGFFVLASGRTILGIILVIVGGILARTGIRGAVGNRLRDKDKS